MSHNQRNHPPAHVIRVPFVAQRDLVVSLFVKAGLSAEHSAFMGDTLARNDQRCVFSHGTRQTVDYVRQIREGRVNPHPQIQVVREAPCTLVLDGDGGLGYFPCYEGTQKIIAKATLNRVAALTTANHYDFGAAGIYTRLAADSGCIGLAASSHRAYHEPDRSVADTAGNSPISIAIPAGCEAPLVMDMSARITRFDEDFFARFPTAILKTVALGTAVRVLGGILPGIYKENYQTPQYPWASNQGSFVAFFHIGHFIPLEEFRREMDRFVAEARALQPLPGFAQAELAGGMESKWEQNNNRLGIPVADNHAKVLQNLADDLAVATPFAAFEHTRF